MMLGLKVEDAIKVFPELKEYVKDGKIDFSNRRARILYNKAICKKVFGLEIDYHPRGLVTPPISRYIFLKTFLRGGERVLEVGTGHTALMAIMASKLFSCEVWATEVNPEFLEYAKRNVERNGATVRLILSRGGILRGVIPEGVKFDVIFSAPPYYPTPPRGVLTEVEAVGGGEYGEGFSIKLLKEAKRYLKRGGKVALFMRDDPGLLRRVEEEGEREGYSIKDILFFVGTRRRHSLIFSV